MKKILAALLAFSALTAQARNTPTDTIQYSTQASAPSSPTAGTIFGYYLSSDSAPYFKTSGGSAFGIVYSSSVFADHGIIVGTGSNRALGYVGPCTNNQALFGVTGSDPTCRVIAYTDLPTIADKTLLGNTSGGSSTPSAQNAASINSIVKTADLLLDKAFGITDTTDSSTGNIDALTSANISSVRLTGAAPTLRGITAPMIGQLLLVVNASGTTVSVKNQDANPTAANRIITGTGSDITLADSASILLKYDLTTSRWRIVGGSGGGSGTSITKDYAITSHGFSVGEILDCASTTSCTKAKADTEATSEMSGIVSAVADSDHFTLMQEGYLTGLSGLTANQVSFLSDATAGAMSTTQPTTIGHTSCPVFKSDSTTSGYFRVQRCVTIAATSGVDACEFYADTGNGHGGSSSGETTVMNFTNVRQSLGDCFTRTARDTTHGDKITFNKKSYCTFYVQGIHSGTTGPFIGVTVDGASLSTAIGNITYANGYRGHYGFTSGSSQDHSRIWSKAFWVNPGQVIRAQDDGSSSSNDTYTGFSFSCVVGQ